MCTEENWAGFARQRPSRLNAKVAESPPVSCNSTQRHWCSGLGDNFCRTTHPLGYSDSFNIKCHGRQLGTQQAQPWWRVCLGRCRATQPRNLQYAQECGDWGFQKSLRTKCRVCILLRAMFYFHVTGWLKKKKALIRTGDLFPPIKDKLSNIFILTSDVLVHVTTFAL